LTDALTHPFGEPRGCAAFDWRQGNASMRVHSRSRSRCSLCGQQGDLRWESKIRIIKVLS